MKLKENKKVFFDDLTHTYWMGDKTLIGVTSLMKKHGLSVDYGDIPKEVLAKAAERGTAVHKMLEAYDNGEAVELTDILRAYKRLGLNVIASEYLVSDNKIVASSIDKVLATDEENVVDLADVKTTSTLHIGPLEWQLSIYAYLFEMQNKGVKVRSLYGIHIHNGNVKFVPVNRIPDAEVKALIKAESEHTLYRVPDKATPSVEMVLSAEDASVAVELESQLIVAEATVAALKERLGAMRDAVYEYMENNNLTELKAGSGVYTRKRPTTRASIDSAKLKAEMPDIAAKYTKESVVKGSISYKHTYNNI